MNIKQIDETTVIHKDVDQLLNELFLGALRREAVVGAAAVGTQK
jgi:hypothetical protein